MFFPYNLIVCAARRYDNSKVTLKDSDEIWAELKAEDLKISLENLINLSRVMYVLKLMDRERPSEF